MALPVSPQTAAMIVGTVMAAAGLNLGVLSLGGENEESPSTDTEATGAEATEFEEAVAPETGTVVDSVATLLDGTPALATPAPAPTDGTVVAGSGVGGQRPVGDGTAADSSGTVSNGGTGSANAGVASTNTQTQPTPAASASTPVPATGTTVRPAPQPTAALPPAPTSAVTAPSTSASTAPPPTAATEYETYEFRGVADVTVAVHNQSTLEVWSIDNEPGWVSRIDDEEPRFIKIKFMRLSDGEEAELELRFRGNDIEVKMED